MNELKLFVVLQKTTDVMLKWPKGHTKAEWFAAQYYIDQGYDVKWTPHGKKHVGRGDLTITKCDEMFEVEVKSRRGGPSFRQIEWALSHPDIKYVLHYVLDGTL